MMVLPCLFFSSLIAGSEPRIAPIQLLLGIAAVADLHAEPIVKKVKTTGFNKRTTKLPVTQNFTKPPRSKSAYKPNKR